MAVYPILSEMARAPHGSPTQKPSILPTVMFATICAGGIVTSAVSLSGLMPPAASQYRIHIACVPGGNVMANVIGEPFFLASSTRGLRAFGSPAIFFFRSARIVMAWPLRLSSQGMTIGFLGDPRRPSVEAIGIPKSMCVAWISPFESESRIAAQLAPLMTVELMPYFLKSPFSWAITMGELSVSAMMPKRMSATSGSVADLAGPPCRALVDAPASDLHPDTA